MPNVLIVLIKTACLLTALLLLALPVAVAENGVDGEIVGVIGGDEAAEVTKVTKVAEVGEVGEGNPENPEYNENSEVVEGNPEEVEVVEKVGEPEYIQDNQLDGNPIRTFAGGLFDGFSCLFTELILKDNGYRYRAYPYDRVQYQYNAKAATLRGTPGVMRAEYYRVNSNMYALGYRFLLRLASGSDLSVHYTYYDEKKILDAHEHMNFGRIRINHLIKPNSDKYLLRVGVGVANVHGRGGLDLAGSDFDGTSGLDIGGELDWLVGEPYILHAGISHSFISSGISDFDVAVGRMFGPGEVRLGWRALRRGGIKLDGQYLSISLWF